MKRTIAVVLLALLTVSCQRQDAAAGKGRAVSGAPIRIGYMICNSEDETLRRFRPLSKYIEREVGRPVETVAIDTINFEKAMERDHLDFTHTNSLLYIILNRRHGVEVMAAEKRGPLGEKTRGLVIARKDSGIKTIADMKDKTMAFGPMLGPLSYLAQYDMMLAHRFDPETSLASYSIPSGSFKHEKVIYGVLFGKYDAGATPELDFDLMAKEGRIDPNDFTVVAKSAPIVYCTWGASQRADEELAKRVEKALLKLKPDTTVTIDGETVKVLSAAGIDGYADVADSEYDPVREMAKRANMPPYQKL
ncbi:MAG: phosphate/phosphite/phosphonate ABC transporter substrate-binding protein [Nitrospirae bacterium]|nr:phosphate/phosphite/phosphonate ABC transporter substrate-binding protein [Nitrospirota bacterium]